MPEWETVVVPRGTFIGWANPPQQVTGEVIDLSLEGGTDFNDQPCPELILKLVAPCENWTKKGTVRSTVDAGEFVTITCGPANLKRTVRSAPIDRGYLVQITYVSDEKTDKGDVKIFDMKYAKGTASPQPSADSLV